MKPSMAALAAIFLWASLATLVGLIPSAPPFFIAGIGLLVGSLLALPTSGFKFSRLRTSCRQILLGVYGLLGYHVALFIALQTAPAVEANLINYLWPLLMVTLSPFFVKGTNLRWQVFGGAVLGFSGAAIAVLNEFQSSAQGFSIGYLFAFMAAVIWATYSLATTSLVAVHTSTVGIFSLISGMVAIVMHFTFELPYWPDSRAWLVLFFLGLGPLGAAFYFWDYAIKKGNPQEIGLLSFLTPLLSTSLLLIITGQPISWLLGLSAALIVGGSLIGRAKQA